MVVEQAGRMEILLVFYDYARVSLYDFLRQCKGKAAAGSIFAFYLDVAVHQCQKLLCNSKAESGSFDIFCFPLVDTFKSVKQLADILFTYAAAGILHGYMQHDVFSIDGFKLDLQHDLAVLCKFYCIICQV